MDQQEPVELILESGDLGALPIINRIFERLELQQLLGQVLAEHANHRLSHASAILLLLRNILVKRHPLFKLSEWAGRFDPHLVGLGTADASLLNDDRIGRSLDALFDADRASLLTALVLRVVERFAVEADQLHNDSTTVTVFGEYPAERSTRKGKRSVALTFGHNKDHRPDLKQLLFTLTVSRDGAVPIHYKSYDGNTTDDSTHIHTWEALRRITARSDFIYVADSKLCTRVQMDHIVQEGGRFICVLPESRKECSWFKEWVHTHSVAWQELFRRADHRRPDSDAQHIYWGYESPMSSREGYRIVWILSSRKQEQDTRNRQRRIEKTIVALDELKQKAGTRRWKSKNSLEEAVQAILQKHQSESWFEWKLVLSEQQIYKQKKRGRPGKNTQYVKLTKEKWSFEAMPNNAQISYDAQTDGMFPLISNISAETLSMKEILEKYKFQPYREETPAVQKRL